MQIVSRGWASVGAVRMLVGFETRRRWRRVAVIAVLVGVVGAVVLSSAAGARRSASALARFNAKSRSGELELTVGDPTVAQLRAFSAVAGVEAFAPLRMVALLFPTAPQVQAIASADDNRFGTVVDRPRVVRGRLANPKAADELTIGETLASELHLGVGARLDGLSFSPKQVALALSGKVSGPLAPDGPKFRLRVVGVVRRPLDLGDRGTSGGVVVLTPAFTREFATSIGSFGGTLLRVRTRHGAADVPEVAAAARQIFGRSPRFAVQDLAVESQGAQNAIDVFTAALWVVAAVAAVAGLVAVAIVLSREISLSTLDQEVQSALGLTRSQRVSVAGMQFLPVALGGALLAFGGAALASPMFPIGQARRAEPDPGFRFDWTVIVFGAVAVAVAILLVAFLAALRATRSRADERSPLGPAAAIVSAASGVGVPVAATTGVRLALEPGRGSTAAPIRSAIFGGVVGVMGIVAVVIFASSLDQLATTPTRYGWTWDIAAVADSRSVVESHSPLLSEPGIAAVAEIDTANVQLDGRPVLARGFRPMRGTIEPEVIFGRAPQDSGEVVLGAATLGELGKNVGDSVHGDGPDGNFNYRIVGRAVFARLDSDQPLANGAAFTGSGLARLVSPTNANGGSPYVVVRVDPGDRSASVERRVAAIRQIETPFGPSVPVEVDRLRQINWLPATLAALIGILALLAVGHALVTSVRRRSRELAVLKTLGFDRHQIRAIISWQATTLTTTALVIGIPAGVIAGNLVWRTVANGLGVSTSTKISAPSVLVLCLGAIAVVNLIARIPASRAARANPAAALRSG